MIHDVRFRALIVDDEPHVRSGLRDALTAPDLEVHVAADGDEALKRLRAAEYHVVLTDVRMPGALDGYGVLRAVRDLHPDARVILITAFGSIEGAVEAVKQGAFDVLTKPIDINHCRAVVRKALESLALVLENRQLKALLRIDGRQGESVVANSSAMKRLLEGLLSAAATSATVLLTGESGTGKELLARTIHANSPRRERAFVGVNCGALPETLFESEIFGHEPGAFTGAVHRKAGVFEQAEGGTLFLDEIAEVSEKNQVDLLRVIEEREVRPLGSTKALKVDVRLVAATNRDVQAAVREGRFREDLYYRLAVVPLSVPPLRGRAEDIPVFVRLFLHDLANIYRRPPKTVSPAVMDVLQGYAWPGNIRQLRNVLERLVIACPRATISLTDLPGDLVPPSPPSSGHLQEHVERTEREVIERALQAAGGRREKAAQGLGISLRSLQYKLKRYGLR